MMFGMIPRAYAYGAIALALLALFGWHKWQVSAAFREGVASEQVKARIEAGKRIVEMEKHNAEFRKLPAVDRCRAFMRDSGLPERHCAP
jgi:hypothetical protein